MKNQDVSQPVLSGNGTGDTFEAVVARRLSRRDMLRNGAVAAAVVTTAGVATAGRAEAAPAGSASFASLPTQAVDVDALQVAAGHSWAPLLSWGDPVLPGAPAFNPATLTPEAQARQAGYNADFVAFFPLPWGSQNATRGLLWNNHEYTNAEIMFRNYSAANPTRPQVDIELAAHGGTVVEIQKGADGKWSLVPGSSYNRRITASTPIDLSGPVAGTDWTKTGYNQNGMTVNGMLSNCGGGVTPWGTVLTAEENFHQYFSNLNSLPDNDPRKVVNRRYGLPGTNSERRWERFHDRFDAAKEPNEPNRFGYVVEIDPYNPQFTPKKRTALGRFLHEAATVVVAPSGRVVVYTGDDARFEYFYKFVTEGTFNAGNRDANMNLLDRGTLYVAKVEDDGTGSWIPLTYGQGPLTEANAFYSQADVLVATRRAADLLGATKMDRPEDIETNPVNKKVYIALTNNSDRTAAQVDKANPRANNTSGHIVELTEAGDDPSALSFRWSIFMLCGEPSDPSTYFAGYPKSGVSSIAAPDNVLFDNEGNLWICSDGQPSAIKACDSVYCVPVAGPERGRVRRFLNSPVGSEVASAYFTPDNRTLFVSIQHPGEGSSYEGVGSGFSSTWPSGGIPRPSVIQVWNDNGGLIGAAGAAGPSSAVTGAGAPSALPRTGESPLSLGGLGMAAGLAAAAAGGLLRLRNRRVEEAKD